MINRIREKLIVDGRKKSKRMIEGSRIRSGREAKDVQVEIRLSGRRWPSRFEDKARRWQRLL